MLFGLFFLMHECVSTEAQLGIYGGKSTEVSKFPYMASLRLDGSDHWCGGSIIDPRFILTAAHCCVEKGHNYTAVMGRTTLDPGVKLVNFSHEIDKIILHEGFDIVTHDYDICLMRLSEPLHFSKDIAKISLASNDLVLNKGDMLTISGWGLTENSGLNASNNLMTVEVPYVENDVCENAYNNMTKLRKWKITDRMICAGTPGKDTCNGDSGGPIVHKSGVQVGITSFGSDCGSEIPGVYIKVAALMDWITKTMEQNK